jgi:hypothetical protein
MTRLLVKMLPNPFQSPTSIRPNMSQHLAKKRSIGHTMMCNTLIKNRLLNINCIYCWLVYTCPVRRISWFLHGGRHRRLASSIAYRGMPNRGLEMAEKVAQSSQ